MNLDRAMDILIVDDFRAMTKVLRNALAGLGFERVEQAYDGEEALAMLRARPCDLVISDWNMAPMSGLDLLRGIRADAALARTRFIMVTADARNERVLELRKSSVDGFLLKPFNADQLAEAISRACVVEPEQA